MIGNGAVPRVGFWRRLAAFFVDMVLVGLAFTLVASSLHSFTGGRIQTVTGWAYPSCTDLAALPAGLQPPPLPDFTFVRDCRVALAGLEIGRVLKVGVDVQSETMEGDIHQSYWLATDGEPLSVALDIGALAYLALPVYAALMEARSGRTFGKRAFRINTIALSEPQRVGIGTRRAFWRQFWLFWTSGLILAGPLYRDWVVIPASASFAEALRDPLIRWIGTGSMILSLLLCIWVIVQLVRKRDPYYDGLAGTAVVRA